MFSSQADTIIREQPTLNIPALRLENGKLENLKITANKSNDFYWMSSLDCDESLNLELAVHIKSIYKIIHSNFEIISGILHPKADSNLEIYYYSDLFSSKKYFGEILLVKKTFLI